MPEAFTPWGGGEEAPVPFGTLVTVWFRMGRTSVKPKPSQQWIWQHTGGLGDILGYQVIHSTNAEPSPNKADPR